MYLLNSCKQSYIVVILILWYSKVVTLYILISTSRNLATDFSKVTHESYGPGQIFFIILIVYFSCLHTLKYLHGPLMYWSIYSNSVTLLQSLSLPKPCKLYMVFKNKYAAYVWISYQVNKKFSFIYMDCNVTFNTAQIMPWWVVLWAEETSKCSWSRLPPPNLILLIIIPKNLKFYKVTV